MGKSVLLIEDEGVIRFAVAAHLRSCGFSVHEADTCETAREQFKAQRPVAVVTDYRLPDGEAMDLITEFKRQQPDIAIVVFTGFGSIELAVQAVRSGANSLLEKPVDLNRLVAELQRAVPALAEHRPGMTTGVRARQASHAFDMSGEVERLKNVDCSMLILGETGTGKSMLARALHDASRRSGGPFVDLNCSGLTRDLVESELFGHERGAFTSAHKTKPGLFEAADGGTLFLDEIGDVDPAVQPRILKAIEEKRFRRMGALRERVVDVRLIAATNRDLRQDVRTGAFRSDLYYRLSTVTVRIPPLRERRDEVVLLARGMLERLARKLGRPSPDLTPEAEDALLLHSWPGNVRELKNVLERALHLSAERRLLTADDVRVETGETNRPPPPATTLRELERLHIERALSTHRSVSDAARSLGISRSSLYLKVKALGLGPPRSVPPRPLTGTRDDEE